jgi:DivIVA domain-containing protein
MTPEFPTALRGYDRIEVDAFVDRVERTLAGSAGVDAVTPESIQAVTFSSALRGYRVEEVDDYLDRAVAELETRSAAEPADPEPEEAPPVWGADLIRDRAELMRCADLPDGRRFERSGPFASGYAVAEVDAFVDRVRGTITSVLTSGEVSGMRFGLARRGYDEAAVDEWCAQVVSHLDRIDQTR